MPLFGKSPFSIPTAYTPLVDASSFFLFPIVFSLLYTLYDRLLWKFNPFDRTPILYGTWIGMANNQRVKDSLRLEHMRIEQTWTQLSVSINVYKGLPSDPMSWPTAKRLGTESSTNAFLSECQHGHAKFNFQYKHDDEAKEQMSFGGALFLTYHHEKEDKHCISKLIGKYCTTKKIDEYEGIFGRIAFRRMSPKLLGYSDTLAQGQHDLDSLGKDVTG